MKHKSYIDLQVYRIKDTERFVRFNGWYLDDNGQSAQFLSLIHIFPIPA